MSEEVRLMAMVNWKVWVEASRPDGTTERVEVAAIERDLSSACPEDLGLRPAEAKDLLRDLQSHLTQDQVRHLSALDQNCAECGSKRPLHDYRRREVDTLRQG
jgi:hypothetical protein